MNIYNRWDKDSGIRTIDASPNDVHVFRPEDEGNSNSGNYGHSGRPGQIGGSQQGSGGYSSRESIEARSKDYTNIRNGLNGDTTTHQTKGFPAETRDNHINKHMSKLGYKDADEYEAAGMMFLNTSMDESTEEMLTSSGKWLRYNHQKNWFAIAGKSGHMLTFFPPDNGAEYWKEQVERHGERK